jgi:hypothetical protein
MRRASLGSGLVVGGWFVSVGSQLKEILRQKTIVTHYFIHLATLT